ncbi:tape measure protein [Alloalcanivorax xenomutans]|uniref:tape measure protein n=1 Tax=Alloalcanivorax xenomutans TaxID=1094342 RepID=UPI003D9ACE49
MAYEARLEIGVDSRGAKRDVDRLDDSLNRIERSGERADRATRRLGDGSRSAAQKLNALRVAAVGFVGAIGTAAALSKLVSVTREFDVLNAQLVTATGSADGAAQAFEAIQDFASTTPYDLAQVTDGFVKLVNLGLTPSERALTSYGDTASAMGKDLSQLIEAVADATTGEFERLKEFGIKARSEGDSVAFTFQGITTTIGKNAAEIEEYLIGLGETAFAGGMERRMATLDGALSNLGDEWDKLFLNISQNDVGGIIESSVRGSIAVLEEMNAFIASGELNARIEAVGLAFQPWVDDATTAFDLISAALDVDADYWGRTVSNASDSMIQSFRRFPFEVNAWIKRTTVDIAAEVAEWYAEIKGTADKISAIFTDDTIEQARQREADALAEIEEGRKRSIYQIEVEKELAFAMFDGQISKAARLRSEYEEQMKLRRESIKDRLAEFALDRRTGQQGGSGSSKGKSPEEKELDRLIEASVRYTKEISAARKADAEAQKERQEALQSVRESLMTEEESVQASYERRRQIVMDNTLAGSEERLVLETKLAEDRVKQLNEIEDRRLEHQRQVGQDLLNFTAQQLSITTNMLATAGKENTGLYKTLLAVQRAAAIPSMVIATEEAATKALAAFPPPANLALATTIRGLGYASVGIAAGQTFAGLFDNGGNIPAGKWGIAGERGPEIIQGPAQVTSRRETAEMMKGDGVTVNVQNAPPGTQVRERRVDGRQIVDIMVADINGGGSLSKAISGAYGLKRRGR